MENTIIPDPSSNTLTKYATTTSKTTLVQVGIGCILVLIILYCVYRFIKNINKRFASLEEVMGRLIEKNNQLHHLVQQSARPMPMMSSPQRSQPVAQASVPRVQVPTTPSIPSPPEQPKPIDLDAELEAELEELHASPPPAVVSTPPNLIPEPVSDEIPEGRVDE